MEAAQAGLVLWWTTTILVPQTVLEESPSTSGPQKARNGCSLNSVLNILHTFLMSNMEMELQPSGALTLARSSAFLTEMLPNKKTRSWIF